MVTPCRTPVQHHHWCRQDRNTYQYQAGSPAVLLPSHTLLSCSHPVFSPKEPFISPPVYNLVSSFQECYVRGIIQYVTFWDWFSFTQHDSIENHPKRVSTVGPLWLLSVVGVDYSLLSHPSRTSGLFLIFGQWEGSCYKYSRIGFCVTRSHIPLGQITESVSTMPYVSACLVS